MYTELVDRKAPLNNSVFWILVFCLFLLLCGVLYFPAITGGWFLDDYQNIVLNDSIKNLSVSLEESFTRRGISYLSFAVDYSLWGIDPRLSRMVNIFIHFCNSLLVVALCREIAGRKRTGIAVVVGMVFLCHPLQTSAVNYVVQRMSLLSALFALCSLLLLCRYFKETETGARTQQILMLCCAVFAGILSVLSKENTVLIFCLVPFIAWVLGKGCMRKGWFFVTVVYVVVPLVAVMGYLLDENSILGGMDGVTFYQDTGATFYAALQNHDYLRLRYLLSQGETFWIYLKLVILPLQQAMDYCWPIPEMGFHLLPIFTLGFLVGVWVLLYKKRNKYPLGFFGFHWVLFFTAVESSVFPLDPIFEHRLYLLMVGICLIVVEQISARVKNRGALVVIMVVTISFYVSLSWQRNAVWGGPETTFWETNSSAVERAPRPQTWKAIWYFRDKRFSEAAIAYSQFLAIGDSLTYLRSAGEAYYFSGQQEKAFELFTRLSILFPGENSLEVFKAYAAAQNEQWEAMEGFLERGQRKDYNDMRVFLLRATIAEKKGDNLNAAIYAQKVINVWGGKQTIEETDLNAIGYVEWARMLRATSLGKLSDWLSENKLLVMNEPENISAKVDFAGKLLLLGQFEQAGIYYKEASILVPDAWSLYYNLGIVSEKLKDFSSAVDYYDKALLLSPGSLPILKPLADLFFREKKYEKAKSLYRDITKKQPNNGEAWLYLSKSQEYTGDFKGAKLSYMRAVQLPIYSFKTRQELKL